MSYEADPNTRRLATRCVCCGLELRDAASVETGIGPICRKKHGYFDGVTDDNRVAANRMIHAAGIAAEDGKPLEVLRLADEIEKLGLTKLAGIIRTRFIEVRLIEKEADEYVWNRDKRCEQATGRRILVVEVHTPYCPDFSPDLKSSVRAKRPVYGEKGKFSHWEVPRDESRALLGVLARCYGGRAALGPKGPFTVPTPAEFTAQYGAARMR